MGSPARPAHKVSQNAKLQRLEAKTELRPGRREDGTGCTRVEKIRPQAGSRNATPLVLCFPFSWPISRPIVVRARAALRLPPFRLVLSSPLLSSPLLSSSHFSYCPRAPSGPHAQSANPANPGCTPHHVRCTLRIYIYIQSRLPPE